MLPLATILQRLSASFLKRPVGFKSLISRGDHALLKPNVLIDRASETGATTDPGIVEQVVLELKELGVSHITIAEGAWLGADTGQTFNAADVRKVIK